MLDVMTSHGQEGWHVLFCGTLEEATMSIAVLASSGTPRTFGFEANEVASVPGQPGLWRLAPKLTPSTVERAVFGRIVNLSTPEQVEMLVSSDSPSARSSLEVRTEDGGTFRYRTVDGRELSVTHITFESDSADVLAPRGERVECAPAAKLGAPAVPPPAQPFLRVWYVPPVQKVAAEDLDPAMVERLRALGYLQ
jgi:hypothetical protein